MTDLHISDVGTLIKMLVLDGTTPVDLSTATTKEILFKHKTGVTFRRAGSFLTNGTDGYLTYVLVNGDIELQGKWELQVYLEFSTGHWHSSKATFEAATNIIAEALP